MPPSKKFQKSDIFVRGHLVVALLRLIHGAGCYFYSMVDILIIKMINALRNDFRGQLEDAMFWGSISGKKVLQTPII